MRKVSLLLLLIAIVAAASIPLAAQESNDPLACTPDGSNGIACGTPQDNECYPGGDMTWESGDGPCEQGIEFAWVCGWYLTRVDAGLLDSAPAGCVPPPAEATPLPFVCLDPNPGTGWRDCLQGNNYFGDGPSNGRGWDFMGTIIPVADTCPAGTVYEFLVKDLQSDFSTFLIANGFSGTGDKLCAKDTPNVPY
ncbi:MAG: hypothetical protein U0452_06010 [Anaerolineae bacterium]